MLAKIFSVIQFELYGTTLQFYTERHGLCLKTFSLYQRCVQSCFYLILFLKNDILLSYDIPSVYRQIVRQCLFYLSTRSSHLLLPLWQILSRFFLRFLLLMQLETRYLYRLWFLLSVFYLDMEKFLYLSVSFQSATSSHPHIFLHQRNPVDVIPRFHGFYLSFYIWIELWLRLHFLQIIQLLHTTLQQLGVFLTIRIV